MHKAHHAKAFEFMTTSALANFLTDFSELLTCSKASMGTNEGTIEKSSENNMDSSGGKVSKGKLLELVCWRVLSTVSFDRFSL